MDKKTLSLTFFLFLIINLNIFGQSIDLWKSMYKKAESLQEKKEIAIKIYDIATSEYTELISYTLKMQASYKVINANVMDRQLFEDWVYYTVLTANKIDFKEGSESLKTLYERVSNITSKGELIYMLGKSGDKKYLPWMNDQLDFINLKHKKGVYNEGDELITYIIKALDFFHDPSSFYYIFYAVIPNYSEKVRKLAGESLKKITPDPAVQCIEIIEKETSQRIKLEALYYAMNSEASNENKILVCKAALINALKTSTETDEIEIQKKIKDEATIYTGNLKAADPVIIKLIEEKWESDKDINSQLISIEALEKIGNDASAKVLADRLNLYIEKKREGAKTGYLDTNEAKRHMIAIIRALGNISGDVGLEELYIIEISPLFANPIKNEAKKAIKKKGK